EKRGVVLQGYLLDFKREGPESPNCYSKTRLDFHMWMGAKRPATPEQAKVMRSKAVVVEPTPSMQDDHPTWTKKKLDKLKRKQIPVTVGLMSDPEHPGQIEKTGGTLGKVHPVMKIERLGGNNRWVDF